MKQENLTSMLIITALFVSVFALGCSFLGSGEKVGNETKLDVTEGVGLVGTLKIEELNPGLDGYLSLTVRNNLGGDSTYDVSVSLDNVLPFKIFECGKAQDPNTNRTCQGQFDQDYNAPYRAHKLSKMFPGEELEVFWRLRAPGTDEISNIALKHPIYYDIEYTYRTSFHQNIIMMSLQEVARKRQAGESWQVEGTAGMGAGELRMDSITTQPIVYQFENEPGGGAEQAFSFTYEFNIENKGTGIPISDVVILLELPPGIEADAGQSIAYKWLPYKDSSAQRAVCKTSSLKDSNENCLGWIERVIGEDITNINKNKTLVRVINHTDFVKQFALQAPLQISGTELKDLRDSNTPMKTYAFRSYAIYRYFIEGKEYITVYPLKVK